MSCRPPSLRFSSRAAWRFGDALTTTVSFAIIATLPLQSTTKGWLAPRGWGLTDLERRGYDQGYGEFDTGWRSPVAKRSKRNG